MLQPFRFFVEVIHQAPFKFTDHSTSASFDDLNRIDGCTHRGLVVVTPTPDIVIMASDVISSGHPTIVDGGHDAVEMVPIEHAGGVGDHSSASAGEDSRLQGVPQPEPTQTTEATDDDFLCTIGTEEYGDDGGLWRFEQTYPKGEDHYKRTNHIVKTAPDIKSFVPQAFQRDFTYRLPSGWKRCAHPVEGKVYYLHKEDRIITEDDMLDLRTATFIDKDFRRILSYTVERNANHMPEDYHVFVRYKDFGLDPEDSRDPTGARYYYYIADHDKSSIFWLNVQEGFEIDVSEFALRGEESTLSPNQVESILERYYRRHVSYFPVRPSTDREWDELELKLATARLDVLTSTTSTIYHSQDTLDNMTKIIKDARRIDDPRSSLVLGRITDLLLQGQIMNYYGEPYARLNFSDSVYEKVERTPSLLFKILSPVLLYAPDVHLKTLDEMWVDKITAQKAWKALVEKLNAEWKQYILLATVFLNANVAFLAIPIVDDGLKIHPLKSPAHIFSFLSTLSNLGGIILSLVLMRHHRTKKHDPLEVVHDFLLRMHGSKSNFETLAILYSLPYALLMSGVLFFSAAFVTMCFGTDVLWMRIAMGCFVAISLYIVLWSIKKLWESDTWSSWVVNAFLNMFGWVYKSDDDSRITEEVLWLRVRKRFNSTFRAKRVREDEESGPTLAES